MKSLEKNGLEKNTLDATKKNTRSADRVLSLLASLDNELAFEALYLDEFSRGKALFGEPVP